MKIPFHKPLINSSINDILGESLASGWLTTGPKVKEFEDILCDYLDVKNVVLVNSCTAALHLALVAIGIRPGDQFIVPTYTFVASVEVGEYLGASPIFVDCELNSFNLDLLKVEDILKKDINNKIKVIIPVHFGGQSVDMLRVNALAETYNLFVIEDAAHAFETVSNSKKVGNTDHVATFSFYANKNITTGGEGGALATNNKELADKVRRLSLHGMNKDGWKRFSLGGKWAYDVSELGYKYNMTDIAASFGLEQLTHIHDWHTRRLEIVKCYNDDMSNIEGLILPQHTCGRVHAWHLYVIRIIPKMWKITRNDLIKKINGKGIGTSVHYIPIHMHSYYIKKYRLKPGAFPVSEELSQSVITLPLFPKMTDDQVEYIISTLMNLWNEYKF